MAGSYEVRVCKTQCAFDSQTPDAIGTVVLFDTPLSDSFIDEIDTFLGFPREKVRACFSGSQFENPHTFAFATGRGVSAWEFKAGKLTFELFHSVDAGYEVTLSREGELFRGTGSSWGAGVAAPGFKPDVLVARRVGPADISWCAKSTTGFIDPSAVDNAVVKNAIREYVATMAVSDRDEFLRATKSDLVLFHFGAGSQVRARYFSANSNVRRAFCGNNPDAYCNIDDASGLMVEKAWEQIQAERDR